MDARITGCGSCLPGPPIDNERLAGAFKLNAEWIAQNIGTRTRYFAFDPDTGAAGPSLAEMATTAAERALASAGRAPEDVDAVILSTATPDHLMPTSAALMLDRLGLDARPVFQVQGGCAGALQALRLAQGLLATGHQRILVAGGDTCVKFIDPGQDFRQLRASELINLALFGDGAGAVLLESAESSPARGLAVRQIVARCEGRGRAPGQTINWFGSGAAFQPPATETPPPGGAPARTRTRRRPEAAREDYKAIAESVPRMAAELLDELLRGQSWTRADVSRFLPPQLAGHISIQIADGLELPRERCVHCVAETGNNGNGLPFIQLAQIFEQLAPGDKVVVLAIESSKWIKTGAALEAL